MSVLLLRLDLFVDRIWNLKTSQVILPSRCILRASPSKDALEICLV